MNLLPRTGTKTFSLLSIGQRGVGKTVFLVGSYAELHSQRLEDSQPLWFDAQNSQAQETIDSILSYIARTGQYPPPTMKITNFNFSLKRQGRWGTQTLCHFRWWDVPGESCNLNNPDFKAIVSASHGCCVFINAEALVHDEAYLQVFEDILNQVVAIASLVSLNGLKYAFAIICTKCDLLAADPVGRSRIEENLQPLVDRLEAVGANYQRFYSAIPIVSKEGSPALRGTGAAAPLLWLISELRKLHSHQSQQDLASGGLMQSLATSVGKGPVVKRLFGPNLPPIARTYTTILGLVSFGIVVVVASFFWAGNQFNLGPQPSQALEKQIRENERVLQRQPNNVTALIELANLHKQAGQPEQAVPLIEKLVQRQPQDLNLRLSLAQLYELVDQKHKAETAYDQILIQEENNLTALVSKAALRMEQGDTKAAKALFVQAEQVAPADLKTQVQALAQKTLQAPVSPMSPEK